MNVQKEIRRAAKLNLLAIDLADAYRDCENPQKKRRVWLLIQKCGAREDVIALSIERHLGRTRTQVAELILEDQDAMMMSR